jgi:hypothetical protein
VPKAPVCRPSATCWCSKPAYELVRLIGASLSPGLDSIIVKDTFAPNKSDCVCVKTGLRQDRLFSDLSQSDRLFD